MADCEVDAVQTSAGPLARRHDWDSVLHAYLRSRLRTRFRWGAHDCCSFALGAVLAMTGADLMAQARGKYKTEKAAKATITTIAGGEGGLDEAMSVLTAQFQIAEVPVLMAQRGDLMMIDTDRGPALAILDFNGREALGAGLDELVRVPVGQCRKAWRI